MENPDNFKRIVKSDYNLVYLARKLSEYKDQIVQRIFDTPGEFNRIVKDYSNLVYLARELSDHKGQIVQHILDTPGEFERIFKNHGQVILFAEELSDDQKDQLSKYILNNPDEFRRIVSNDGDLQDLATAFPNCSMFKKSTVKEAIDTLRARARISLQQKTATFFQSKYNFKNNELEGKKGVILEEMPDPLIKGILVQSVGASLNEKEAEDAVGDAFEDLLRAGK